MKVGIMGCTGYAGRQLVNILMHHKKVEIVLLSSGTYAGQYAKDIFLGYKGVSCMVMTDDQFVKASQVLDVVFLALPHKTSMEAATSIFKWHKTIKIIDLSADYRFTDASIYEAWYETPHKDVNGLKKSVYGLPELFVENIQTAQIIGNPGCYPTSVLLGLMPLLNQNFVNLNSVIIDAKSGYSGAGIKPEGYKLLTEGFENAYPYGGTLHRHIGEIEQVIKSITGVSYHVQFTPNLIPVKRGIISNIYIQMTSYQTFDVIYKLYEDYYKKNLFVKLHKTVPQMKWAVGTNECHIGFVVDKRTHRIMVTSAIDNLIKGAAGQAVQNLNIMFGFKENEGLEIIKMS